MPPSPITDGSKKAHVKIGLGYCILAVAQLIETSSCDRSDLKQNVPVRFLKRTSVYPCN